jgi:hypothetical protein
MIGIKILCEYKGITKLINGSYEQSLANFYGITQSSNGSWIQAIAEEEFGLTNAVNGSWVQAIVEELGASKPINADWYLAWLEIESGEVQPYWVAGYSEEGYVINS